MNKINNDIYLKTRTVKGVRHETKYMVLGTFSVKLFDGFSGNDIITSTKWVLIDLNLKTNKLIIKEEDVRPLYRTEIDLDSLDTEHVIEISQLKSRYRNQYLSELNKYRKILEKNIFDKTCLTNDEILLDVVLKELQQFMNT